MPEALHLSYAVTSHNEGPYLRALLEQLFAARTPRDEIVLLDDFSTDRETIEIIEYYRNIRTDDFAWCAKGVVHVHEHRLNKDFAAQKNYLNSLCRGQYILQVDADELLAPSLLTDVHSILDANPDVDLFYVPRVNRVEGLTSTHVANWGWQVDRQGRVMWPDYQSRLYRNTPYAPKIEWKGAVHERITGHKTESYLPADEAYALIHTKTIARQEEQNRLYSTITR